MILLILSFVVIIIIVITLLMVFFKKKKHEKVVSFSNSALNHYPSFSNPKDFKDNPLLSFSNLNNINLRTVNYNIFGRWFGVTGYEGQDERLAAIPGAIARHPRMGPLVDVITIEEAWCPDTQLVSGSVVCLGNKSRDILIAAMQKEGWKYYTDVVDKPGVSVVKKQTGGGAGSYS